GIELDDDRLPILHVFGQVDARRGALVDEAPDLEPPADHRPRHAGHLVVQRSGRDRVGERLERLAVPRAVGPRFVHLAVALRALHVSSSIIRSTLRKRTSFPFWWWCFSARVYLCSWRRNASSTSASVRGAARPYS